MWNLKLAVSFVWNRLYTSLPIPDNELLNQEKSVIGGQVAAFKIYFHIGVAFKNGIFKTIHRASQFGIVFCLVTRILTYTLAYTLTTNVYICRIS